MQNEFGFTAKVCAKIPLNIAPYYQLTISPEPRVRRLHLGLSSAL